MTWLRLQRCGLQGQLVLGHMHLGPRSPRDRQWCSPVSPYCLWKWNTISAYSLQEEGVETKAGGQPQVQGQPKLQSGTVSDNQRAASAVRQLRACAPPGGLA